jgi:hypothetical protein
VLISGAMKAEYHSEALRAEKERLGNLHKVLHLIHRQQTTAETRLLVQCQASQLSHLQQTSTLKDQHQFRFAVLSLNSLFS